MSLRNILQDFIYTIILRIQSIVIEHDRQVYDKEQNNLESLLQHIYVKTKRGIVRRWRARFNNKQIKKYLNQ